MVEGEAVDRRNTGSAPGPDRGGERLAGRGVRAAEQADTAEESHIPVSGLLLFYRFRRRSAKAIRVGFYVALSFMASVVTVVMNDAESREAVGFNVWILASSGIFAVPALLGRLRRLCGPTLRRSALTEAWTAEGTRQVRQLTQPRLVAARALDCRFPGEDGNWHKTASSSA
ncbi:hypothetical protein [Streptomyces sp. NRRL F-525]|uniref:hypothetical protein n=1 Tax=Streptomyces sp. NRRL F-525 TaxID=1463861 RepID=UPI0018FE908E|nr:hypothetical protein [Streptomyces sp. NRRL F-525]